MDRTIALRLIALTLAPSACFSDAPDLEGESETETDATGGDDDDDDGTSPTSAPESTADGDADADADASADGTIDDSDGGTDSGPCEGDEPECLDPGDTVWSVVLGEAGYDAAYALAVDGDRVLVVGEREISGGDTSPWTARLSGVDGTVEWEQGTNASAGHSDLRAVVAAGDGRSVAAGNIPSESVTTAGYLEHRNDAGESGWTNTYTYADTNYLLGLALDDAGGFHAVGHTGDFPGAVPLLLHYADDGGGGWQQDFSSDELATFGVEGQLFGLDHAPNGSLVIAGARMSGATSDAWLVMIGPEGSVIDEHSTGGPMNDGFVDVDVDADGNGVAVGRSATGESSGELLVLHFAVGDALEPGWEHSWGEAMSTNPNGFARDGDALFIAAGVLDDPKDFTAYDSAVIRWDGEADDPTWVVPFETDMPGRDYAMDVALYDDETIVACGVVTPDDGDVEDAWIRRLAR